jgi:hypothetical protein
MSRFINLVGKKYGMLTVAERAETDHNGHTRWICKCDCGNSITVDGYKLKNGHTNACGCRRTKLGLSRTRQYHTWQSMMSRCYYPKNIGYSAYGGRGITVCENWHTFVGFWKDMECGYSSKLTLDRIDSNGIYTKENCRWATMSEQGNNRRTCVYVQYKGTRKTVTEISEELGVNREIVYPRLKRGWDIDRALNSPIQYKNKTC